MATPEIRAILIGGSSHSGKSTLAEALGARPGWTHISTDGMARHPGRPWPLEAYADRPHVLEHYKDLSVDELIVDVLAHYKSLWPAIETLVSSHVKDHRDDKLILEGSALWPDQVATLKHDGVAAVWLTASDELFETRIKHASGYENRDIEAKALIDKFLARTLRYNTLMMERVHHHGLRHIKVSHDFPVEALVSRVQEFAG